MAYKYKIYTPNKQGKRPKEKGFNNLNDALIYGKKTHFGVLLNTKTKKTKHVGKW